MTTLRVLGKLITYSGPTGQPEIVLFAPFEDTLYQCRVCHQQFAAWQEDLLYRSVREVRKTKVCLTCRTPLWRSLVEQERIPWRDGERAALDHDMRAKGYELVSIRDEIWKEFVNLFCPWE